MSFSIGIFYATSGGRTRGVVERMKALLEPVPSCYRIAEVEPERLLVHDLLILGGPTYGRGELHYHWVKFLPGIRLLALDGRAVALFALGDQRFHGATFAGSLAQLHREVDGLGARRIGAWPTTGYDFESSPAARDDGTFPGLVIDEISQRRHTDDRLRRWTEQLLVEFRSGSR